jgi:hypothetical protein
MFYNYLHCPILTVLYCYFIECYDYTYFIYNFSGKLLLVVLMLLCCASATLKLFTWRENYPHLPVLTIK